MYNPKAQTMVVMAGWKVGQRLGGGGKGWGKRDICNIVNGKNKGQKKSYPKKVFEMGETISKI